MAKSVAERLGELLQESVPFAGMAQRVQEAASQDGEADLEALRMVYGRWYADALSLLPGDAVSTFKKEYEGGFPTYKIKHFLQAGHQHNVPAFDELVAQGTVSRWQYPADRSFCGPLLEQQQILRNTIAQLVGPDGITPLLDELEEMFRNLPTALAVLAQSTHGQSAIHVTNEYDLQRIVHAILSLRFHDVRPEEYGPSRAGARPRIDFLLKDEAISVEVKGPRDGLTPSKLGNELSEDLLRYQGHPDVDAYFALVYDPKRQILNARGFEKDFATGALFPTRVVIVQ